MRRIFKLDPNERITIPEILSHSWLKASSSQHHYDLLSPKHNQHTRRRRNSHSAKSSPVESPSKPMGSIPADSTVVGDNDHSIKLPPIIITQLQGIHGSSSNVSRRGSYSAGNIPENLELHKVEGSKSKDLNEGSSGTTVTQLPDVHPERRVSLNSKILHRLYSPILDLPKETSAPRSLSTKETSSASTTGGSKSILTRLNRTPRFSNGSSLHLSDNDATNKSWRDSQRRFIGSTDRMGSSEYESTTKSSHHGVTKSHSISITSPNIENSTTPSGNISEKIVSPPS